MFDGSDTSQVYDLKRRVARTRQYGGSIESYYNTLQGLWRKIDFWRSNPMKCAEDIQIYNSNIQEDRVYVFLDGLDDRLDKIRNDVLQIKPFPTVEQAYAHVRREDTRQAVMLSNTETTSSLVLLSKGFKIQQLSIQLSKLRTSLPSVGRKGKGKTANRGCTHYGNPKHTRKICFKVYGYPEWWKELKERKK